MKAELLDAETEAQARLCVARRARRRGAAPADHRLHAAGDFDGGEVQALRRADERPDPGSRSWPDEGRRQVRPRSRRAVLDLRGLVDQGVDPGLRDAQLVDGAHRVDLVSQKSLFFNMRRVQARLEREAMAEGETLDKHQLRQMIATEVGVPLHDVEMMEGRLAGSDFSLNATQSSRMRARVDRHAGRRQEQAAETVEHSHDIDTLRGWLVNAMQALNERERFIVRERKLREEPRTLESLGNELGLSKERVRQLEAAAFGKMRKTRSRRNRGAGGVRLCFGGCRCRRHVDCACRLNDRQHWAVGRARFVARRFFVFLLCLRRPIRSPFWRRERVAPTSSSLARFTTIQNITPCRVLSWCRSAPPPSFSRW
jgi:hypothetical protein